MKRLFRLSVPMMVVSLMLSACASTGFKAPSKQQRAHEFALLKAQQATEFMNVKDYRQAVLSIDEAVKSDAKSVEVWLIRAQIYQFLKVNDKAEESFHKALNLDPKNPELNNNYGWFVCDVLKKPQEAMTYFDRALSDPTYPTPQVSNLNKGICSARSGQYQLAEAYFERALALAPNFSIVWKEMARARLLSGNLNDADFLFRRYQSTVQFLSPDDLLLGWHIARAFGQDQQAYEYEAQLYKNYPYSPELMQLTREMGR